MILSNKYVWIKIPRTATYSYKVLFLEYNEGTPETNYGHLHYPYIEAMQYYGKFPGVTVVRNPLERFISSLKYVVLAKEACAGGECTWKNNPPKGQACEVHNVYTDFLSSTQECVNFFNTNFKKNCLINASGKRTTLHNIFRVCDPRLISAFFITQVRFAYHPNVTIFKYENLEEFNEWIEKELQYDVSKLQHENSSKRINLNIDFHSPEFIKMVENLFYDDYKIFNYQLKYHN